jgi:Txe/YoeB family toxin of toxin-antitoxin system
MQQEINVVAVRWQLVFTKQAQKDARKLARAGLKPQAEILLEILANDPFQNPPTYEKLLGDLQGAYSRRINIQHRLVYQVLKNIKTVKVIRMWTHYE